jgi:hypothetical protein
MAVESVVAHRADAEVVAEWHRAKSNGSEGIEFVEAVAKLRDRKKASPPDGASST